MHKQLLIVMLICLKGADYICTAVDKKGFSLAPERLVR